MFLPPEEGPWAGAQNFPKEKKAGASSGSDDAGFVSQKLQTGFNCGY